MLAFPWDKCDSLQQEFSKYCLFPEIRSLNTVRSIQIITIFSAMYIAVPQISGSVVRLYGSKGHILQWYFVLLNDRYTCITRIHSIYQLNEIIFQSFTELSNIDFKQQIIILFKLFSLAFLMLSVQTDSLCRRVSAEHALVEKEKERLVQ